MHSLGLELQQPVDLAVDPLVAMCRVGAAAVSGGRAVEGLGHCWTSFVHGPAAGVPAGGAPALGGGAASLGEVLDAEVVGEGSLGAYGGRLEEAAELRQFLRGPAAAPVKQREVAVGQSGRAHGEAGYQAAARRCRDVQQAAVVEVGEELPGRRGPVGDRPVVGATGGEFLIERLDVHLSRGVPRQGHVDDGLLDPYRFGLPSARPVCRWICPADRVSHRMQVSGLDRAVWRMVAEVLDGVEVGEGAEGPHDAAPVAILDVLVL